MRRTRWNLGGPINPCGLGKSRRNPVAGPREHTNRHLLHDSPPILPVMKLNQIICPHQPNKLHMRIAFLQRGQRLGGVACAQFRFDPRNRDSGVPHQVFCNFNPCRQWRRSLRFQRITGGYQPPHLIQSEPRQSRFCDVHMPAVRGVKRPSKQPYGLAASGYGKALFHWASKAGPKAVCKVQNGAKSGGLTLWKGIGGYRWWLITSDPPCSYCIRLLPFC